MNAIGWIAIAVGYVIAVLFALAVVSGNRRLEEAGDE